MSARTQQFTAIGRDAGGTIVAITPTWSVVAGGGTIDGTTGLFTAGSVNGTYSNTVQASSGALAGFATVDRDERRRWRRITVTPNPVSMQANGTQQFTAVGKDAGGNAVPITPVVVGREWRWHDQRRPGCSPPARRPGTFTNTVRATSGAISGVATVIVTRPRCRWPPITVTPNPVSMLGQRHAAVHGDRQDANGNVFPMTPVWSVVNGGGTIDANTGLFTAGAVAGTFANTVKATSGAISGTATVTVTP